VTQAQPVPRDHRLRIIAFRFDFIREKTKEFCGAN